MDVRLLIFLAGVICYFCAGFKVQASVDWVPLGHAFVALYFLVGWLTL